MNAPFSKLAGAIALPVDSVADPMISFQNISKRYDARGASAEVAALEAISLDVPKGAIVGVIGRSGAGKSTLVRLVNGLEKPTQGQVIVDQVDMTRLDERALRQARRSIGMIFQHFNLLSSRTAFENVALPLEIAGYDNVKIADTVKPLLDMVGLSDKRDRYPSELSGGQKQRVGIARALVTNPKVLLSDEATSALDPETTDNILALLAKINAELGLTILFITHEMAVVKKIAHRVAVLDQGRIVEQGPTYDVFADPRHPVTARFVGSVTGAELPEWLTLRLHVERQPGDAAVLSIRFTGQDAGRPVLSRVSRDLEIDINLLHGQVEMLAGHPFGTLLVSVPAEPDILTKTIASLKAGGSTVEHIGYVA